MDAWKDALQTVATQADEIRKLWQQGNYEYLIFTGCGSTYYLSQIAASLLQAKIPVVARAVPASELLLSRAPIVQPSAASKKMNGFEPH